MRALRFVSIATAVVLAVAMFAATPAASVGRDQTVMRRRSAPAANPGANGKIIYINFSRGTMTMNPDGTGKVLFTYHGLPTGEVYPEAWAPEGHRFVVVSPAGGNLYDMWVIPADGSRARDLTNQYGDETGGSSWSPDATQVAYGMNPRGSTHDIWRINADGTGREHLTNAAGEDLWPAWSPDGSKIAFASERTGHYQIYTMDTDGTDQTKLSNSGGNDTYPAWSPDGTQLAFVSDGSGQPDLYVMDTDGSHQVQITNDAASEKYPSWSPDGTRIVFSSYRTGNEDIFSVNSDGTGLLQLTSDPADEEVAVGACWQPLVGPDATVGVSDSGFTPTNLAAKQGWMVEWDFTGSAAHAVKDTAGLGLFGSGTEPPGGTYAAWFFGAGTFSVLDPTTLANATVAVPTTAKPPSGPSGTTFTVKWSSQTPPKGFTFDVQMRIPGSKTWTTFLTGTSDISTTTSPSTPGTYRFRVRLRNGKAKSDWSPAATFKVT